MNDHSATSSDIQESDFTPQDHYKKALFLLECAACASHPSSAIYCSGLAIRQIAEATIKESASL